MTPQFHQDGNTLRTAFSGVMTFHDHQAGEALVDDLGRKLAAMGGITEVRFDLSEVETMDSHWLGVFIRVLRHARTAGAKLVMEHPQPDVRRLFSMVELDRLIDVTE